MDNKLEFFNNLFNLDNLHALVTGGGSGIGQEIALTLAKAGATITLVGRQEDKLIATVNKLREISLKEHDYISIDLSQLEFISQMNKNSSIEKGIDIFIHCAGMNPRKPALETSSDDWNKTIQINLTASFEIAKRIVPHMKEKKWGRIINIASLQAKKAFPNSIAYGVTKGAIPQFTRAMAVEWSQFGINCNAIAPGLFNTKLTESIFKDENLVQRFADQTCVDRNGELTDIQGLILYLCSKSSDFLTGQTLFLDGGNTAK